MNKGDYEKAKEMDLIYFSQDFEKEVSGNKAKYLSFKEANARISAAILNGFYLEAITIQESIITDRLFSFYLGVTKQNSDIKVMEKIMGNLNFYKLINACLKLKMLNEEQQKFLNTINEWRGDRNNAIHSLAKSIPGTETINFKDFLLIAKKTALNGVLILNQIEKQFKNNSKDK